MNNTNLTIDLGAAAHAFEGAQDNTLTTEDILEICGAFDTNALFAAIIGATIALTYLFYVRRWRGKMSEKNQEIADKAAMTSIALLFVVIVVRLLRSG